MRAIRQLTDAAFNCARREAFAESDGACVKCGREAVEGHHVYGPLVNDGRVIRPLCYWCHLVAPVEAAYWAWEHSGKSGPEQMVEYVRPRIRATVPELTDAEFESEFRPMMLTAIAALNRCVY